MLYRFREAQMEELGIKPRVHLKPRDPMRINNLRVCEKWRLNVIKEIGQKVVKIQDSMCWEFQPLFTLCPRV